MHEPEEHRLALPALDRIKDIVVACQILSSEGFGDMTPNELSRRIAEALSQQSQA